MKRDPRPITPKSVASATLISSSRVKSAMKLAEKLRDDPDRERRLASHRCLACFYFTGLAGQAFTQRDCGACGCSQTYPSTSTDALCMPCAQDRFLCKHCGGDLELRTDRQSGWDDSEPTPSAG
jgi:hypothetical protein